ncbi:unnamed protein product [Clavelina lepadiformis]|uniref:Elongation factor 1-gamma n=1 Tax=Clavelina lepadiformis TaxID=159417 RepID=A0ABP0GZA6_CLALP
MGDYAFNKVKIAQKIQITANYSGFDLSLAEFVAGVTNKSDEFLKKFPLGKVPAFEGDSINLFEPNAIAFYVGNDTLRGGEAEAEVWQWIGVADNDLMPAACTWVYPTLGLTQYNKQSTEKAKEEVKTVLNLLNNHLLTRTFLVGERVSQADISMACTLLMLYINVLEPGFRKPYGNVNRWFVTLVNQPEFKKVLGEVSLCTKMAQFDAKKYNEISGKGGKKDQGKKEQTQKKPQQKEDKPANEPPAPKPKLDPWRNAPKPSMDLDAWKRCYSNNPVEVSWKYFLEHFKKEDYSIWRGAYQYNSDLKMDFMASNLVAGMFQRLEKLRKHGFGSVLIFGGNRKFQIDSVWFWLGHDLAFDLCEDWQIDYESYKWTKLNFDDDNDRKMIKEFWAGEGEFDGRECLEQKVYK